MSVRRPRLRTWLLWSVGVWLMLRQLDGVLRQLQEAGDGGYVVGDLGPLSPAGLVDQVKALLEVWNANDPLAGAAFYAYTGLDMVFIFLYAGLLLTLIGRVGAAVRAKRCVVVAAAADFVENLLRIWIVAAYNSDPWLVYLAWAATMIKWLALAGVVLLATSAWNAGRERGGPDGTAGRTLWALWRLRIPVVLLGAFGLMLIFDPTGQSPDTFRRWFDGVGPFAASAAWTGLAVALLSAVTWTTVRRTVLADYAVASHGPHAWRWILAAVAAAFAAESLGWDNLYSFPIVVLVVIALGAYAWVVKLGDDYVPIIHEALKLPVRRAQLEQAPDSRSAAARLRRLAKQPPANLLPHVRHVARLLSVWPLLALLLALVSAWTAPPVVLLAGREHTVTAIACVAGVLVALALTPFVAFRLPRRLRTLDTTLPERSALSAAGISIGSWPDRLELRHLIALGGCGGICIAAIAWPLSVPPLVGVVGMVSVGVGALVAALGEAQRYGETHPPTRGLRMLGFDGFPLVALLGLAFFVASVRDDGDYHRVARAGDLPERAEVRLDDALERWVVRNCAGSGTSGRTIPMVFVASQGGGIRAAYWTTSVLTTLFGTPAASAGDRSCPAAAPFDRVFAMNGASGGSLGISSYAGNAVLDPADVPQQWYRDAWGKTDLASVPVAWGLLVDLPRSVIGWDGPDRARRFEQAWEGRDATLREDFFASQAGTGADSTPILLHASTQVESGCRMNVSPLRLTVAGPKGRPSDCTALDRRAAGGSGAPAPGARMPTAPLTSDVLDYLCVGGSLRRSTAALMSARFPYVSPSGRLVHCGPERAEGLEATAVVDGGYAENTGSQAIVDLWARLEPAVAAHNAKGRSRIVPVFVDVDNHYAKSAQVGPVARTPQMLVPPLTFGRPDKLDNRGTEQLADARFSVSLSGLPKQTCRIGAVPARRYVHIAPPDSPGIPAPLAWTLSNMAMDELDHQREAAFATDRPAAILRDALSGAKPLRCTARRR